MKQKQAMLFIFVFLLAIHPLVSPAFAYGTSTSNSTVSFREKDVTPPVDPENPKEPQTPPEVIVTGQEGSLTMDVVPHPYFGEHPVPTLNTTLKSKIVAGIGEAQGEARAQTFIQVSDARPDIHDGWNVTVKADPFINSSEPDNFINGAKIIFLAGTVRGPSEIGKPVSNAVTLNCITGGTQNEDKIFAADSGNGIGTWVNCLYQTPWASPAIGSDNSMIQLFIPANSGVIENNTYYSNLTWTLSNAP